MKKLMIAGALVGFAIGGGFGFANNGSGPTIVFRAAVAACCAGLLMRWWGRIWIRALQETYSDRLSRPAAEQNLRN